MSMLFRPFDSHDLHVSSLHAPAYAPPGQSFKAIAFLVLCPLLPNNENTVPSVNLLTYFKCDRVVEVSKIIMLLQSL